MKDFSITSSLLGDDQFPRSQKRRFVVNIAMWPIFLLACGNIVGFMLFIPLAIGTTILIPNTSVSSAIFDVLRMISFYGGMALGLFLGILRAFRYRETFRCDNEKVEIRRGLIGGKITAFPFNQITFLDIIEERGQGIKGGATFFGLYGVRLSTNKEYTPYSMTAAIPGFVEQDAHAVAQFISEKSGARLQN